MADVTDAIKIIDTLRSDDNSDLEELDDINFDENIEISLDEEIFIKEVILKILQSLILRSGSLKTLFC